MGSLLGSISILDVPMDLCLKFHYNWVSNSWDIANSEFLWWGVVCKVIFMSSPTWGYVRLSWVVVELGFWQFGFQLFFFPNLWLIISCIPNSLTLNFFLEAKGFDPKILVKKSRKTWNSVALLSLTCYGLLLIQL